MPNVIRLKTSLEKTLDEIRAKIKSGEITHPLLIGMTVDEDGDDCVVSWSLCDDLETDRAVWMMVSLTNQWA